jgi:hypothetical protein
MVQIEAEVQILNDCRLAIGETWWRGLWQTPRVKADGRILNDRHVAIGESQLADLNVWHRHRDKIRRPHRERDPVDAGWSLVLQHHRALDHRSPLRGIKIDLGIHVGDLGLWQVFVLPVLFLVLGASVVDAKSCAIRIPDIRVVKNVATDANEKEQARC